MWDRYTQKEALERNLAAAPSRGPVPWTEASREKIPAAIRQTPTLMPSQNLVFRAPFRREESTVPPKTQARPSPKERAPHRRRRGYFFK